MLSGVKFRRSSILGLWDRFSSVNTDKKNSFRVLAISTLFEDRSDRVLNGLLINVTIGDFRVLLTFPRKVKFEFSFVEPYQPFTFPFTAEVTVSVFCSRGRFITLIGPISGV